ncbi:hypothetical protein [Parasulfitobacter algicola]|uniref:Uncharacterized protein n=1 Tax=Parasulfitobacter algicola TaxID=2614809 RepID=A0ABX2ISF2_9RHOB|nr:hypothetical protein [Sulfitobacter algicola]NSX55834.1 hypothetical protein [Sulfitobacter algicola]
MKHFFSYFLAVFLLFLSVVAVLAEATGGYSGLGDFIMMALAMLILYLVTAVALLVFAIKGMWRAFSIWGGLVFVLTILYPLIDVTLMSWQTPQVERAEIKKDLPDLREKQILYITTSDRCWSDICDAISALKNRSAVWVMPPDVVVELDFSEPIDLATIDLVQWRHVENGHSLNIIEKNQLPARPVFDYVILARQPYYLTKTSSIEPNLPVFPTILGMKDKLILNVMAAPLTDQKLILNQLKPDYLTYRMQRKAVLPPLFPENTMYPERLDYYDLRRETIDAFCGKHRQTPEQRDCARELN